MKDKFVLISVGLFLILVFIGCRNSNNTLPDKTIKIEDPELIDSYNLKIPEPSGLSFTYDRKAFWSVSDQNSTVYKINFIGEILDSIVLQGVDLEGITAVDDTTIAVIFEYDRRVAVVDLSGNVIKENIIETNKKNNSGLEGITYVPSDSVFYLLNEKDPGLLIKLDKELNVLKTVKLDFAKDYSSIFYSVSDTSLWILSDESHKVFKCDMEGNVKSGYKIEIPQPEGFVMDPDEKRFYVVSDSSEKIYIYEYK